MAEVHRRVHSGDEEGRRPVDEFCWHPERGIQQQQQQQQLCHADGYADQENDDITQFRTGRRRGKRSVTWYDHLHGGPRTPADGEYHEQTRSNVFEGEKAYEELEWGRAWQGQRQESAEEGIRDNRVRSTQMGVSCARGACPYSTAGMTVPDDLKEAADVHWLNSLDGEACLLVDSYRDLSDGVALEEAFCIVQGLCPAAPQSGKHPVDRIRNSLIAVVENPGRSIVPPWLLQPVFTQRVCNGEPIACGDLIAFLKNLHGRSTSGRITSAAAAPAPALLSSRKAPLSHNAPQSQESSSNAHTWRRGTTGEDEKLVGAAAAAADDTKKSAPPVLAPGLPSSFTAAIGEKLEPRCRSTCPVALDPGTARPAALRTLRDVASARRANCRQRKDEAGRDRHVTKQKKQVSAGQEPFSPRKRVASVGVDRRRKHQVSREQHDAKQKHASTAKQETSSQGRRTGGSSTVSHKRDAAATAEKYTTTTTQDGSSRGMSPVEHGKKGKCCCRAEQESRALGANGMATDTKTSSKCCGNEQTGRVLRTSGRVTDVNPSSNCHGREQTRRASGASGTVTSAKKPSSGRAIRPWCPSQRGESVGRDKGPRAASSALATAAIPRNNRAPARSVSAADDVPSSRNARSWSPPKRCESAGRGRRPRAASASSGPVNAVPTKNRVLARLASAPPPLCKGSGARRGLSEKAPLSQGVPCGLSEKVPLCDDDAPRGLIEKATESRVVSAETIRGTGKRRAEKRGILRWMGRLGLKVEWSLLTPEDLRCHERLSSGVLLCELAAAIDYAVSGGRGLPLSEVPSCPGRFVLRGTCGTPSNAARSRHNVRTALGAFRALGGVVGTWLRSDEAILEGDHEATWGLLRDLYAYYGRLRPHRVPCQPQVRPTEGEEEEEEEKEEKDLLPAATLPTSSAFVTPGGARKTPGQNDTGVAQAGPLATDRTSTRRKTMGQYDRSLPQAASPRFSTENEKKGTTRKPVRRHDNGLAKKAAAPPAFSSLDKTKSGIRCTTSSSKVAKVTTVGETKSGGVSVGYRSPACRADVVVRSSSPATANARDQEVGVIQPVLGDARQQRRRAVAALHESPSPSAKTARIADRDQPSSAIDRFDRSPCPTPQASQHPNRNDCCARVREPPSGVTTSTAGVQGTRLGVRLPTGPNRDCFYETIFPPPPPPQTAAIRKRGRVEESATAQVVALGGLTSSSQARKKDGLPEDRPASSSACAATPGHQKQVGQQVGEKGPPADLPVSSPAGAIAKGKLTPAAQARVTKGLPADSPASSPTAGAAGETARWSQWNPIEKVKDHTWGQPRPREQRTSCVAADGAPGPPGPPTKVVLPIYRFQPPSAQQEGCVDVGDGGDRRPAAASCTTTTTTTTTTTNNNNNNNSQTLPQRWRCVTSTGGVLPCDQAGPARADYVQSTNSSDDMARALRLGTPTQCPFVGSNTSWLTRSDSTHSDAVFQTAPRGGDGGDGGGVGGAGGGRGRGGGREGELGGEGEGEGEGEGGGGESGTGGRGGRRRGEGGARGGARMEGEGAEGGRERNRGRTLHAETVGHASINGRSFGAMRGPRESEHGVHLSLGGLPPCSHTPCATPMNPFGKNMVFDLLPISHSRNAAGGIRPGLVC